MVSLMLVLVLRNRTAICAETVAFWKVLETLDHVGSRVNMAFPGASTTLTVVVAHRQNSAKDQRKDRYP